MSEIIERYFYRSMSVYYCWWIPPLDFFSADEDPAFTPNVASTCDLAALFKRFNIPKFPQLDNADDGNEGKPIDHFYPGNAVTIPHLTTRHPNPETFWYRTF